MKQPIQIAGLKIPNIIFYILGFGIIIYLFNNFKNGISSGLSNLFKNDSDLQKDDVLQNSFKILEKNPSVKSEMTTNSLSLANALFDALDGFGTDKSAIYNIFLRITGPNQMGAIFHAYGKRTLTQIFIPTHTGDLQGALKNELSVQELNENRQKDPNKPKWSVQTKLNWLSNFKG